MYGTNVIREAGLISRLSEMGRPIVDHGDISYQVALEDADESVGYIKHSRTLGNALKTVSDSVYSIVSEHQQTCVVLGGDHSLSIGSLHGHARAEPNMCVIWIDAHADLNLPQTSPSRNLHGMVLSFVCKETKKYLPNVPGFEWCSPCIDASNIAYIGLRDIDPGESYILDNYGMKCFDIHQIDKYGIAEIFSRAMEWVNPRGDKPIHLSFDIDSLDPIVSPSTGTPVWGGLTYREGMYIAEEVSRTNLMSVVDLVEVNPQLGTPAQQEATVQTAVDVLMAAIGKRREGNTPPDYKIPDP
ncbi:arginase-1-like [Amphiura filiformis]|uniref:arginase-1-like n=1 Tax=Amphiura filiformis TaxID=82378 RepID=UPI003B21204F